MQQDTHKTKIQLLDELRELRQRNIELETSLANSKETEEHLRSVSETSFDAIVITDQDGNIVFWNKAATEIFGYEAKEVIGNPVKMLMPVWIMGDYNKAKERLLETGFSLLGKKPIETVAKRKNGSEFPVETAMSNWKIQDKYYFGGTFRDITERKRTEALLRESEKRFRDIFDFAIDGILIADSQTRKFQGANRAICRMLGYSLEELKNLGVENIHPDECLPSVFEYFGKMVKGTSSQAIELPTQKKDGSVFYADINAHPLILDGKQCLVGIFRDVTERKQAEEALENSESRYRELFNNSKNALVIYEAIDDGRDFIIKEFNRAAESIEQLKKEALIGKFLTEAFPGVKEFGLLEVLRRVWKTGKPEDYPVAFYQDKRISGWRENYAYKLPSGEIVVIYEDITERKRVEKELINTKDFLENIYNTTPDVMMVSDKKGYVISVNKAVEKILGFNQEELIGKHTAELFPNDEKHAQIGSKILTALREKGVIKSFEANWLRKDGSLCPIELNITMLQDRDGNRVGGVATIRDITERKHHEEALREKEERFRTIAESSLDVIITTDSSGEILYCNKSVQRIYGYTAEELMGKSIAVLEPAAMRPTSRKKREDFVKDGHSSYIGKTAEGIGVRKDGSEVAVEVSSSHWKIGDKIIFGGIVRDITQRKQMEEQLRKSHAELEKKVKQRTAELRKANEKLQISQEYLKKFAGMLLSAREEERKNISTTLHDELGSMAISVASQISIAREECKENNKQATFKALEQAQSALRKAVEDLRRLAVDLRPPNLEIVGLTAALADYFNVIKKHSTLKITFRNDLAKKKIPDDRAIVIYRVIQETLTNIIKHAKAQKVSVSLYAYKNKVHLDITDDGVGFDIDKIYVKKGRLKIGITGMRERVESMGGEFFITSAPKRGTQIKVILHK